MMFKPAGPNSIYVPLAVIEWWWKGEATKDAAGNWNPVAGTLGWKTNPNYADTTDHPEWSKNIKNLKWVDD